MKEQIQRIKQMEKRLDRVSLAVKKLKISLQQYEHVQDDIQALSDYYHSDVWKQDFAADEAGLLPYGVKRGVLSEDAVWNLLEENLELRNEMLEIVDI